MELARNRFRRLLALAAARAQRLVRVRRNDPLTVKDADRQHWLRDGRSAPVLVRIRIATRGLCP